MNRHCDYCDKEKKKSCDIKSHSFFSSVTSQAQATAAASLPEKNPAKISDQNKKKISTMIAAGLKRHWRKYATPVALFTPLFFYLLLDIKEIPDFFSPLVSVVVIPLLLFALWGIFLYFDMKSTYSIKDKIKQHESNDLFRNLYKRFGKLSIIIQILGIETGIVVFFPVIAVPQTPGQEIMSFDIMGSAILAASFGILHLIAWRDNKKEIAKMRDMKLI